MAKQKAISREHALRLEKENPGTIDRLSKSTSTLILDNPGPFEYNFPDPGGFESPHSAITDIPIHALDRSYRLYGTENPISGDDIGKLRGRLLQSGDKYEEVPPFVASNRTCTGRKRAAI